MSPRAAQPLDLAGIGIGPFNLSLAALLDEVGEVSARFFERRPTFDWHPGMMLPDVELQSSYLKDLVTAASPTNPWSFVSYLVRTKRFFAFLNAHYDAVPRREFAQYLAWVAEALPTLRFGTEVREVSHDGHHFVLDLAGEQVRARHIAIGVGMMEFRPDWAAGFDPALCFHANVATERLPTLPGGRIAVIGGGQSGAEIVQFLLAQNTPPQAINWISRRHNFEPLNDTPFSNQVFSPEYVDAYRRLGDERKAAAFATSVLTSDGISPSTIDAIYRRLYAMRYFEGSTTQAALLPRRDVIQAEKVGGAYHLVCRNDFDGGIEVVRADAIVLATGYRFTLPDAFAPLKGRIVLDRKGRMILGDDYALAWDGPHGSQIFAMNAGRHSHGIADSQLSLMAWRSATIINALLGRARFDLDLPEPMIAWASTGSVEIQAAGANA